jgi:NTP pyrophosphatase (non-canonical NTP hydrolase)
MSDARHQPAAPAGAHDPAPDRPRIDPEDLARRSTTNPLSIAALQKLIHDRYFATDSARGIPPTFMWFIEEVGELSTALANNAPGRSPSPQERANLEEEFADVLAWLCTLANISGVDLERALQKYTVKGVAGIKH